MREVIEVVEIVTQSVFGELNILDGEEPKFTLGDAVVFQYIREKKLYSNHGVVIGVVFTPPEAVKVGWWYAVAFYRSTDSEDTEPWTEYYIDEADLIEDEGVKIYLSGLSA